MYYSSLIIARDLPNEDRRRSATRDGDNLIPGESAGARVAPRIALHQFIALVACFKYVHHKAVTETAIIGRMGTIEYG